MPGPLRNAADINPSEGQEIASLLKDDGITINILNIGGRVKPGVEFDGQLAYDIKCKEALWARLDDGQRIVAVFPFSVIMTMCKDEDSTPVEFAKASVRFQVSYEMRESLSEKPDSYLENFVGWYGFIHVWPYARAEFQSLTAKLGVPPLTLPIVKVGAMPTDFSLHQLLPSDTPSST